MTMNRDRTRTDAAKARAVVRRRARQAKSALTFAGRPEQRRRRASALAFLLHAF